MATKELAPLAQPAAPLYGIEASNQGRLIVFAGGIPRKLGGRIRLCARDDADAEEPVRIRQEGVEPQAACR
jgi:hypothetical protein